MHFIDEQISLFCPVGNRSGYRKLKIFIKKQVNADSTPIVTSRNYIFLKSTGQKMTILNRPSILYWPLKSLFRILLIFFWRFQSQVTHRKMNKPGSSWSSANMSSWPKNTEWMTDNHVTVIDLQLCPHDFLKVSRQFEQIS